MPGALLLLLLASLAAPQEDLSSRPGSVTRVSLLDRARLVALESGGSGADLDAALFVTGLRSHGIQAEWRTSLRDTGYDDATRILFVQSGEAEGLHLARPETSYGTPVTLAVGDLVLLRPKERIFLQQEIGVLSFTLEEPLPEGLPTVIRPDHDPQITDTPGGCATESGAYRRVCLTWEGKNGPYLYQGLNAHRVRIRDSFTHYHPVDGGFDELYLVQDALPGSEIIVCERLAELLDPSGLDAESASTLLRRIPVKTGDLVLLPRGTAHRGVGGILAQVITVPGFVPGAELGVDDAIRAVNAEFDLELAHHDPGAPFVAVLEREDHVRIEVGDQLFTEYRFADGPRAFFHPVLASDGRAMTRGYPMAWREGEAKDHPHHQSLWFAHGSVNGVDFWHDPNAEMRLLKIEDVFSRSGLGGFTAVHDWIAPDGSTVLHDRRVFRFHAGAAGEGVAAGERWIDWDLRLTAPANAPVRFGDTKEGTMAFRVAASMRVDGEVATGRLVNAAGQKDGRAWGKRSPWLLANGLLDGRPAAVAILEHPRNFRFPTWWHAREYGLLAANPFGAHDFEGAPAGAGDFELAAGETLRLRYRFVLAAGELAPRRVTELATGYGDTGQEPGRPPAAVGSER
ncbi:MAG: PmoA family protein [Planctomycetes bacterium]|nr:PmoA family protein [Planctomycetota bacterium]